MENQDLYKKAKRRVREIKDFYGHLFIFVAVNTFLIVINLVNTPNELWFYWSLIFWGLGIISHAISVFGFFGIFGQEWEEKKIQKLMEKEKAKAS